jgi:Zn-dependent protease
MRFRRDVSMGMGILLVAGAGPASNVVLGAFCTGLLWAAGAFIEPAWKGGAGLFVLLESMVLVNVLLAVFNLLPIPPLDGGRIADALMPREWRPIWDAFTRVGPILLIAVLVLPIFGGRTLLSLPVERIQEMLAAMR